MADVAPRLVTLAARAQVLLERYKQGVIDDIAKILVDADKVIRLRLSVPQTNNNRRRMEEQLAAIKAELSAIYGKAGDRIIEGAQAAGPVAASQEIAGLASVLTTPVQLVTPTATQIYAAAVARPFTVGKTPAMLDPFVKKWVSGSIEAADNTVRLGFLQGRTNQQIIQDLRGTKAAKYKDGVIGTSYKNAQMVTRTAVQHVATTARMETFAQNSDIVKEYEWVSVLDDRTTDVCQALSGQKFEVGKGPIPPQHIGCRSTLIPAIDEEYKFLKTGATQASKGADGGKQVDASLTYYDWLKTQPDAFQDTAVGPMRAALLRDGGLTADRFAELQLGKNFQPLTLAQMIDLEPTAFDKAGISISEKGRAVFTK
mgnify:CR=1 FL=1